MAFNHICEYKKVGFVNNRPSKELVRELMYLTMPEVEGETKTLECMELHGHL